MKALIHRDEVLRAAALLAKPHNADRYFSANPEPIEVEVQPIVNKTCTPPFVIEDDHG